MTNREHNSGLLILRLLLSATCSPKFGFPYYFDMIRDTHQGLSFTYWTPCLNELSPYLLLGT